MGNPNWKKGVSGNPTGRPPSIYSGFYREIEKSKSAVKKLIIMYFEMTEDQIRQRQQTPDISMLEKMLGECIARTTNDGNVDGFRKLLEIPFGKLPEETPQFETTPEEQEIVMEYRRRLIAIEEQKEAVKE